MMTALPKDNVSVSPTSNLASKIEDKKLDENLGGEQIRVLLVDDDDNFREAIGGELTDLGFSVANFSDGDGLLNFVAEGNVADVIVLDWQLREATGLDIPAALASPWRQSSGRLSDRHGNDGARARCP